MIRTPDQRLRVFISSTLKEMKEERNSVREAVERLRLTPVLFELGARPYPPRALYRAYLEQSQVFVGLYWQRYGWVAPDMEVSGLEDELLLATTMPRLIYIREPAPDRESRLAELLGRIKQEGGVSYKPFQSASELEAYVEEDLALLLSERFEESIREGAAARQPRSTVPAPVSPFIGRTNEVRHVHDLLARPNTRLLTLVGPGGIGKSRLALEVAQRALDDFEDGVTVVPLDTVSKASMVLPTIVQALELQSPPGESPLKALENRLQSKEMLIVLDGFEHVIGAAPAVAELLERCGRLKVLVTSREVLRLSGERLFEVPPLEVPPDPELSPEAVGEYEGVRLLVERAQAAREDFQLDASNHSDVAKIVRRLEGLPLAIELAAARLRLLPPKTTLERLENRLGLLTGGPRDLPERQQTLRKTIDWSYDLLQPAERALLARLSVFVGGWTLHAAQAVCDPDGEADVMDALSSLIDKSLVRLAGFAGGESRFTMLDTVREYASERLMILGETERLRDLHADYFLHLSKGGDSELIGPPRENTLELMEVESGNIRSAMKRFLDLPRPNRAARMGWRLWNCWWLQSRLSEAVSWMEQVLASSDDALQPLERSRAAFVLGFSSFELGDEKGAVANFEIAQNLAHELGDSYGEATALSALGRAVGLTTDPRRGEELLGEAVATFRTLEDSWGLTQALFGLGELLNAQGRSQESVPILEEAVQWARESGQKVPLSVALVHLGWAHIATEDFASAQPMVKESFVLARDVADLRLISYILEALTALQVGLGNLKEAAILLGACQAIRSTTEAEAWSMEEGRLEMVRRKLREGLGEAEFSRLLTEGKGMTLQEALRLPDDL